MCVLRSFINAVRVSSHWRGVGLMDDSSVLKGCLIRAVFVRWRLWPQQGGICVGAVLGVWNESGSFCMSLECFANSIPELKFSRGCGVIHAEFRCIKML